MSKEYKYVGRQTDYHRAYYYKRRREMLDLLSDRDFIVLLPSV